MKIGYLGPEGTFSEEAGAKYLKKLEEKKAALIPYGTFHDLLFAIEKGKVAEGVLPIENSIEGTIEVVLDALAHEVNLKIRQEIVLDVFHNLIAKPGVKLSQITDVISVPPALDQCRDFLRKKLPKAKLHFSHSTADAVSQVAKALPSDKVFAAIGTAASAKLYGMQILAAKINPKDNQTRFVVLAKKDHPNTGCDKTAIVFSMKKNYPGCLYDVLGEFAARKINLTKIESRPSKKALGDYYFFIDMEGHRQDEIIAATLKNIKQKTGFYKLLGSYPQSR